MSTRDAAFLWETEALRSRRRVAPPPVVTPTPGWVTLRRAHETTGVPVDTLRKWGRRGLVPSMMVQSGAELRRLVRLESVVARARAQGRSLPDTEVAPGSPPPPSPAATEPRTAEPPPTPAAPEGTMIVPIAAWDKMLMQLGNLHEAGRQLAEARERAAKAETEATFLRERLAEMRAEHVAPVEEAAPPVPRAEEASRHAPAGPSPAAGSEPVWEYALRRWRMRRKR